MNEPRDTADVATGKRAIDMGMSLRGLDPSARTGRYFQNSTRRLVLAHVARAAAVLGGEIRIEWEERGLGLRRGEPRPVGMGAENSPGIGDHILCP